MPCASLPERKPATIDTGVSSRCPRRSFLDMRDYAHEVVAFTRNRTPELLKHLDDAIDKQPPFEV
jgi:hypothetical protein